MRVCQRTQRNLRVPLVAGTTQTVQTGHDRSRTVHRTVERPVMGCCPNGTIVSVTVMMMGNNVRFANLRLSREAAGLSGSCGKKFGIFRGGSSCCQVSLYVVQRASFSRTHKSLWKNSFKPDVYKSFCILSRRAKNNLNYH